MRTIITIEDELLDQLKVRAASQGTTVSRLIEESVRLAIGPRPELASSPAFELITFGRGGHFSRFDVDRTSALLEQDDLARFGRQR